MPLLNYMQSPSWQPTPRSPLYVWFDDASLICKFGKKLWSYMMPNVFTETRCHYATLPTVLFHVIPSTDTFTLTSHLVYIKRKTLCINNSNNTLSIHVFLFWLCCTFYCLKLALPSEVIKFVYIPIQTPEEYLI